jgi:hypothetical protein
MNPFEYHGVTLYQQGDQLQGQCPFCQKDDHFYVNTNTNQYDCKSCAESGNLITFIKRLHEHADNTTTQEQLEFLSQKRGIRTSYLNEHELAVNPLNGEWLLPVYNHKGKLSNLLTHRAYKGRVQWMGTPTLKQHLYGIHEANGEPTLWISEGHYDKIALTQILGSTSTSGKPTRHQDKSLRKTNAVAGMPGAGTFKTEWIPLVKGFSKIVLLYDNDKAGRSGLDRFKLKIAPHLDAKISYLDWDKAIQQHDLKDSKDVNDLLEESKTPYKVISTNLAQVTTTRDTTTEGCSGRHAWQSRSGAKDG